MKQYRLFIILAGAAAIAYYLYSRSHPGVPILGGIINVPGFTDKEAEAATKMGYNPNRATIPKFKWWNKA